MEPLTMAAIYGGGKILGGIADIFSADKERDAARARANAYKESIARQEELASKGLDTQTGIYQPYANLAPEYLQKIEAGIADGSLIVPEMGTFGYDKNVKDFLDPSVAYQMERGRQNLEQSAIAGGGLNSGATLRALQEEGQKFAQTDYANAANRMQTDKNFSYTDWINHFNNQTAQVADRFGKLQNMLKMGLGGVDAISSANMDYTNSMMGAESQRGSVNAEKAALNDVFAGKLASTVGNTFGGLAGAATYAGLPSAASSTAVPDASTVASGNPAFFSNTANPAQLPTGYSTFGSLAGDPNTMLGLGAGLNPNLMPRNIQGTI